MTTRQKTTGSSEASLELLGKRVQAWEPVDTAQFQKQARILQSIWREDKGIPIGEHRARGKTRPLGSRIAMPYAKDSLANFLTENIRSVVGQEVLDKTNSKGKLFGKPRIFNDLLSSQPLCFNLFGELRFDLTLASQLIRKLTNGRYVEVLQIEFEHSPGRSDPIYTGDRSAFDVFLICKTASGKTGFIGIEVKYHENLANEPGTHRERYDELAQAMGCFREDCRQLLRKKPIQQIWRDHLLCGALRATNEYADGFFAIVYPAENDACRNAIEAYRKTLTNEDTFISWTLEDIIEALAALSSAPWIAAFHDRYLDFSKIDSRLGPNAVSS